MTSRQDLPAKGDGIAFEQLPRGDGRSGKMPVDNRLTTPEDLYAGWM